MYCIWDIRFIQTGALVVEFPLSESRRCPKAELCEQFYLWKCLETAEVLLSNYLDEEVVGENVEGSCNDDEKRIEFQYMTVARYRPLPSPACTGRSAALAFLNCPFNPFGFSLGCSGIVSQIRARLRHYKFIS